MIEVEGIGIGMNVPIIILSLSMLPPLSIMFQNSHQESHYFFHWISIDSHLKSQAHRGQVLS